VAKPKVFVLTDDQATVAAVRSSIESECEVFVAAWDRTAVVQIHEQAPLVMLLDLGSSSDPTVEERVRVLQEVRQTGHAGKVIACTEQTERRLAVRAIQSGAYDVLSKPLDITLLTQLIRRAAGVADLEREARGVMVGGGPEEFSGMLGTSASIHRIFDAIRKVSTNDAPILITGESGTGKELTARAIHERGLRRQGPFIPINCGAIPESLLESELFGYERGAFTGAVSQKKGKVEFAQGGTLFLDEVGELPNALQVKLLRFLQDHTFERVGGHQPIEMNVRIIAATNVNLKEAIEKGTFREDLYYRLNVVPVYLPPLRERTEDIPVLARHFIARYAKEFTKRVEDLHPSAVTELVAYPWPGNVRELRNVMERAVMLAKGDRIGIADVAGMLAVPSERQREVPDEDYLHLPYAKAKEQVLEAFNRRYISTKLTIHQGNVTHAAQDAGLPRSYFHEIMRRYTKDEK